MERTDLIERIQKLMGVTAERGATPHEAEIAASKIGELLLKYKLDLAEVKGVKPDTEMGYDVPHDVDAKGNKIYRSKLYMPEWMNHLAVSIGHLNFCEVVGNEISIYLGLKKDVELAVYMFESLLHQIRLRAIAANREWVKQKYGGAQPRDEMYGGNHPRAWRESWTQGACSALASKFFAEVRRRNEHTANAQTSALVVDKQAKARSYAETRYPVWYGIQEPSAKAIKKSESTRREPSRAFSNEAFTRGHKAGESMSVNQGIGGSNRKSIDA